MKQFYYIRVIRGFQNMVDYNNYLIWLAYKLEVFNG